MTRRRFALAFVVMAAAALGHAARVPATPAVEGLQLRVVSGMAERLAVDPVGTLVRADALQARPGANATLGRVLVADQTHRPVTLQVRALPSARDLDDDLQVSVSLDGKPIRRTDLGHLRAFTNPVTLRPGRPAQLSVRIWLPAGTPQSAYVGRSLDVVLELHTDPVITP